MRITIVNEDAGLRQAVAAALEQDGHEVDQKDALDLGHEFAVITDSHLAILDTQCVPIRHVYRLLSFQQNGNATLLLVTGPHPSADERIEALESGADAFIPTPTRPRELIAKSRALLRRHPDQQRPRRPQFLPVTDDWRLDLDGQRLVGPDKELSLSLREFRLLCHLVQHEGFALSREQLLAAVWGDSFAGDQREVDVYVRYLRKKLEPRPGQPAHLLTVWGVGYQYRAPKRAHRHHGHDSRPDA